MMYIVKRAVSCQRRRRLLSHAQLARLCLHGLLIEIARKFP